MNPLAYPFVLLATAAAAFTDLRTQKIPNGLVLPLLPLGLALNFWSARVQGVLFTFLGIALCSLVPLILWRASSSQGIQRGELMGGGDLKLFAGIGALVGPSTGLEIQLLGYVGVMIFALFLLTWRGQLWRTLLNSYYLMANWVLPQAKKRAIPAGELDTIRVAPAAFAASCVVYFLDASFSK
jgi:prepilin peptidase CpaA